MPPCHLASLLLCLQEPWTFQLGGKEKSRHVSLVALVCQTMASLQHMARPRTRTLVPTLNGIFATLRHVNLEVFDFLHHIGMAVRWRDFCYF